MARASGYDARVNVDGVPTTSLRLVRAEGGPLLEVIDQRALPHQLVWKPLGSCADVTAAIAEMHVRGAPLIGACAAFGVHFAAREACCLPFPRAALEERCEMLGGARPTAVNLHWAVRRVMNSLDQAPPSEWAELALAEAQAVVSEDVSRCRQIGQHGLSLISELAERKSGKPVQILTHCNAGWLACVDYGTATSPIYQAHDAGIPVHVWVDETRPRNQGAKLTAWELGQHGVPHTVIADNTGGHLMQHNLVDICIVGSDRVTRSGDMANKIGTYLKALAARDNAVPFYVAFPSSTIDWEARDGLTEIPIELRDEAEVTTVDGWHDGRQVSVRVTPKGTHAANYAFDVTPARLVTGFICERGVCEASEAGLLSLFEEGAP